MKRIAISVLLFLIAFSLTAQSSPFGTITAATPTTSLRVGDSVAGELSRTDVETADGSYIDWYFFPVESGESYRIELSSEAFDTFLVVRMPDGPDQTNDDADFTDSALVVTPRSSGELFIGATSFGFAATGPYLVQAVAIDSLSFDATSVAVGEQVAGVLSEPRVTYDLVASPGELVEVVVRSGSFDTYLEIEDADGNYFYNDDSGSTSVSRILYTMSENGGAQIIVSAWDDSSGSDRTYTLQVVETNYEEDEYPDGYELSDGEFIETILVPQPGQTDYVEKLYTVQAEAGERIELTLRSDSFDSFITVYSPSGTMFEDDDSAGNLDSLLSFVAPETGVYEVYVSSLGGAETGPYTVEFVRLGAAEVILEQAGELSESDERDVRGRYYDLIVFSVTAGDQVIIEVQSDEYDGFALLQDADGTILAEDDDGAGGYSPRIEYTAEESGDLTLVVTTYSRNDQGEYKVLIYR